MSTEIRQSDLRNDDAVIMRRVVDGESFVVMVDGRPIADIVPHRVDSGRRRFVATADAIAALTATELSERDAERWWNDMRDGEEDPWERHACRTSE